MIYFNIVRNFASKVSS